MLLSNITLIPIVEELCKFIGVYIVSRYRTLFNEIDDGIVYGASVGLGFATLETILYALASKDPLAVGLLRASCCTAMHAASTAFTGWGYAFNIIGRRGSSIFIGTLIMAIILHSIHNYIASMLRFIPSLFAILIIIDMTIFIYITSHVE